MVFTLAAIGACVVAFVLIVGVKAIANREKKLNNVVNKQDKE